MGRIRKPLPVKLVVPMLSREERLFKLAEEALEEHFGPVDYRKGFFPFDHTDYYRREFGEGLLRNFIAFERLVDPGDLAAIKCLTNELEMQWSIEGRRQVNLDPGYVSLAKLILATTKNHAHRVYVGRGIYAEVTLCYREGDFRPWPWTYPDYASPEYIAVFREIRAIYLSQLRAQGLTR